MADRRSKPRLNVSLDAMWDSSTEAHSARVTNLSESGCYLSSVGDVRQGEVVGSRVLLPEDDWLYLEGEVRHHTPHTGFGVQFVDLNEAQTAKLTALLLRAAQSESAEETMTVDLVEE